MIDVPKNQAHARFRYFQAHPTIRDQMTVLHRWGVIRIGRECDRCRRALPDRGLRGRIRGGESVITIQAEGVCPRCLAFNPVDLVIHLHAASRTMVHSDNRAAPAGERVPIRYWHRRLIGTLFD